MQLGLLREHNMVDLHTGGCVCGAIRYETSGEPLRVTICHCAWCQRRTGTAFGVEPVFKMEQVRFITGTPAQYKHVSDESGRWLLVEFCSICGSNIGFTLEIVPGVRTIAAGTFDDPQWIDARSQPFRHVFVRSARTWSNIPDDVERYEMHFRA